MYLTKAIIPKVELVERQANGLYGWHKLVWSFFRPPGATVADLRDFLFRADYCPDGVCFLVSSQRQPTKPEWLDSQNWNAKSIAPDFQARRIYRFSVRANPTKDVDQKRQPLRNRADRLEWLKQIGQRSGFEVENDFVRIGNGIPTPLEKTDGTKFTISLVDFDGFLRITDVEKFRLVYAKGFGDSRSFGCGMLLVMPANRTSLNQS